MKIAISADARSIVARVAHLLAGRGVPAYAVGGYVRDLILNREPHDVDIALGGDDPLAVARAVAEALGGSFFVLDFDRGYSRVLVPGTRDGAVTLDFTPLQGSLLEDLARRDFAFDAMALPLSAIDDLGALVDPWGGRSDIQARIVRALSEAALREDPARLLRAFRLAGELGFRLDPHTATLLQACAPLVQTVSGERIRDEFCRVLDLPGARSWLWEMDALHLLTEVLPEISPAKGVEQPKEHYWDVFSHLIETVGFFERILDPHERATDPVLALVPWDPLLDSYFNQETAGGRTRRTVTKLACLLHDVAKPQTKKFEPSGRMRFFGHAEQGAETARIVLERMRFSRREIAFAAKAIEEHLRPMQLSQDLAVPTRRALYRYYRDLGEAAPATLFLSLADYLAAKGPLLDMDDWRVHAEYIAVALAAGSTPAQVSPPPPLVDGHVLMRELGLAPGPMLGRVLAAVQEAIGVGEARTVEDALEIARRTLASEQGRTDVEQEE